MSINLSTNYYQHNKETLQKKKDKKKYQNLFKKEKEK